MANSTPSGGLLQFLVRHNIIDDNYNPTLFGHITLTASILLYTSLSYICLLCVGTFLEYQWLDKEVETSNAIQQSEVFNKQTLNIEDRQQRRIIEQLNTINDLKVRHCRIMSFFYKQYFCLLSIGSPAALIALISVFFISKKGWEATNNAVINIGMTSLGVTLFALNTTQVFQQSENLKTSQDLYSAYVSLHNDVRSAVATQELVTTEKMVKLDTANGGYKPLIHYTDARLKVLSFVRLGFDPTPISDLRSRLDSTIGDGVFSKPAVNPPVPVVPPVTPAPVR